MSVLLNTVGICPKMITLKIKNPFLKNIPILGANRTWLAGFFFVNSAKVHPLPLNSQLLPPTRIA